MSENLNVAVELHDSVVDSITHVGQVVKICLRPAYLHKSVGQPGLADGIGLVQDLILEFGNGQIEGNIGDLPSDIFSGNLQVGLQTFENMIELPCNIPEAVSLTVFLSPDNRKLSVSGQGLRIHIDGDAVYVEEFRPNRLN